MSAVWTLGGNSSHVAPLIPEWSEWYKKGRDRGMEEMEERMRQKNGRDREKEEA